MVLNILGNMDCKKVNRLNYLKIENIFSNNILYYWT